MNDKGYINNSTAVIRLFFTTLILSILCTGCSYYGIEIEEEEEVVAVARPDKPVEVGVYYVPHTKESATAMEATLAASTPRFPEQFQPKRPSLQTTGKTGINLRKQANLAHSKGIDAFIFHWHCNSEGPYQNYMPELFADRRIPVALRYALIWKNDHADSLGDKRSTGADFRKVIDHLVDDHFKSKAYWRVDGGKPYFSIYDLKRFLEGYASTELAKRSLRMLRNRTTAAGHPGLHLNATTYGLSPDEAATLRTELELDSLTTYNWSNDGLVDERPGTDYLKAIEAYFAAASAGELGYYNGPMVPSVSMGWDPAPLWASDETWKTSNDYPYGPIIVNNNAGRFGKALSQAKALAKEQQRSFVLLHAWNDWLHGSYLEPEEMFKDSYLNGIKHEFIDQEEVDLERMRRWRHANR